MAFLTACECHAFFLSLFSPTGVLNSFNGIPQRWTFDNAGNPVIQTSRDQSNSFAFGNFPDGCDFCFAPEDYENILPAVDRTHLASSFRYELHDSIEFFSDFKYTRAEVQQQFQPSFRFGNVSINVADNPYLDNTIRQQMLDAGVTSSRFAKFFDELGNRSADNRRETFRFVAGFDGDFTLGGSDLQYELFYINSETTNRRKTLNDLIPGNLLPALDAVVDPDTGEIACRSQVPDAQADGYEDPATVNGADCAPYNAFGLGQSSEAARAFVSADVQRDDEMTQEVIGGSVLFDTSKFLTLPGGPIGIALGFEYREENSEALTDEFTKRGFLAGAATPDQFGEFDVSEGFIEVNLPILADMTGIQELTIDLAYRAADYDPFGDVDATKVGILYAPIESQKFRGTWGEAVRAPNIEEAFSPQSPGFARVSDPCDADNIADDPDRAANCLALGIPAGFQANDNVSVDIISGGNPDLDTEDSESHTVGVVWVPQFIEDFSLTLDFYDIEITDAINEVDAQDVVDNCVDASGGPDSGFCAQIDRDPITNDVSLVRTGFLNAAALNTSGVEMAVN